MGACCAVFSTDKLLGAVSGIGSGTGACLPRPVQQPLHCPNPALLYYQEPWMPVWEGVWPLPTMLWINLVAKMLRLCNQNPSSSSGLGQVT